MAILLFGHNSSGRTSLLASGLYNLTHSASDLSIKYDCITSGGYINPFKSFEENLNGKSGDAFFPDQTVDKSTIMATLCGEGENLQDSFAIYIDNKSGTPIKSNFSDFECNQIVYLLDGEELQNAYLDNNSILYIENVIQKDIEFLKNEYQNLEKVEYFNIFITKSDLILCDYRLREILTRDKIIEDLISALSKTSVFKQCVINYSFVTLGQELIRGTSRSHYKPYHTEYVFLIPMLNQLWWKYNRIVKIIDEKLQQIEEIRQSSTKSRSDRLKLDGQVKEVLQPSAEKDSKYIKYILEYISFNKALYNKGVKCSFGEHFCFLEQEDNEG